MRRQFFYNFRWGLTGEAQEMLVDDGIVVFRQASELGHIQDSELIDLNGAFVLPAFIDSHCHILPTGLDLAKLHLGDCRSPEEVLDAVRDRNLALAEGEWLLAVHYDQTKYADAQHMSREQVDGVVGSRPAVLRHSNGHAGVASSAALAAAGIDDSTPDPKGGTFVRDASGRLTGVLLETALERVMSKAPQPDVETMVQAILAAGQKMSELGIACATDMMTGFIDLGEELDAYRIALDRGCPIDIRLCLQWSAVLGPKASAQEAIQAFGRAGEPSPPQPPSPFSFGKRRGGRIAGLKIFADGAIGSATAAIHGSFLTTGGDGQLIYAPERLKEMVRLGHEAGYPIAIHSIGDRSTDLVMDAYEALGDATKHRIEHVMLLSDAQIERLAKIGCSVTMQPEFLQRFGHAYRRQLPEDRYRMLERFRSVCRAGIPMALNSDRPIVPGDPWDGILTAANRPEGFDPSENLDRMDGIKAYTEMGSILNGDGQKMGALECGSQADLCIYAEDPVTDPRPTIAKRFLGGAAID